MIVQNSPHKNLSINVVIPVFNEEKTVGKVISELITKSWINKIIVVDDDSTDSSATIIKKFPVIYLKNKTNKGAGYSTLRGLRFSQQMKEVCWTATVDADRQHTYSDLFTLYKALVNNQTKALILHAVRRLNNKNVPFLKKVTTKLAWKSLILLYGSIIEDPFCGLNIYSHSVIPTLNFSKGYDWPINLLVLFQQIQNNVILTKVPAHYSKYSLSKGMTFKTSLVVFGKIIVNRIKEIFYEKNISSHKSVVPTSWWN